MEKKYYYQWGNEPSGYVSTYTVVNWEIVHGPLMRESEALANGHIFDCPYP